jgi:hypothetical protein
MTPGALSKHNAWDAVLYLGRMRAGMRLAELGEKVGMDYANVVGLVIW